MSGPKRKRFESAVASLQQQHGTQVLVPARAVQARPAAIATGFSGLDALLEIGGVPLNALSMLSGPCTSGKLTLAYKILSHAQQPVGGQRPHAADQRPARGRAEGIDFRTVIILDLAGHTDPDYLARCGIRLDYLLLARPQSIQQAFELLLDIVRSRQACAILLDSLAAEGHHPDATRAAFTLLPRLHQMLNHSGCAVILLDEPHPLWQRWTQRLMGGSLAAQTDLHLEVQRERWLERAAQIYGYRAQVRVLRNRWGRSGVAASIAIEFNGTVRARETW